MKFYGPAIVKSDPNVPYETVYRVIDTGAPDQPAVVGSFYGRELGLYAKKTAQFVCDLLNDLEIVGELKPDRSEP